MNKRVFIESIFLALLLMVLTIVWKIAQGYFFTKSLIDALPQGSQLTSLSDSSISFGTNNSWGLSNMLLMGGVLLITVLYYIVRTNIIKRRTK